MKTKTLVNGCQSESVSTNDRGFAYGDGVFETIKIVAGVPQLRSEHIQRLSNACQRMAINCDISLVQRDIDYIVAEHIHHFAHQHAVLKVVVTRGCSGRGYKADPNHSCTRVVSLSELPDLKEPEGGASLVVCQTRLSANPALAGLKHLCRLEQVLASHEWDDPAIAEGLMLDTAGHVIEGTKSNVFFVKEGRLLTPDLRYCGVEGIIRNVIIEKIAPALNIAVDVADYDLETVCAADEVFISNSLIGLWSVSAIASRALPDTAVVTQSLKKALAEELNV